MRRLVPLLFVACAAAPQASPPLPKGGLASVGALTVTEDMVVAVAATQHIAPRDALERLVSDALLASHGAEISNLRFAEGRALANRVVARVSEEVRALGPPTDDEVAELTRIHWKAVDVPEQAHVVHAVVMRNARGGESVEGKAIALAERIREVVAKVTTAEEFESRAKEVPHPDLDVRIQTLPRFVEDGRYSEPADSEGVEQSFAKATFALSAEAPLSGVVVTRYGWHIIRLLEKTAAKRLSLEERRARFEGEVIRTRGGTRLTEMLRHRTQSTSFEEGSGVESLMAEATALVLSAR